MTRTRLSTLFSAAGIATAALTLFFHLTPLLVLEGAQYLTLFTVEQLQALVRTSLHLSGGLAEVSLAFWVALMVVNFQRWKHQAGV